MSTSYQPDLINEPSSEPVQTTAIRNHNLENSPGSMPQPHLNSVSQRPQHLELSQLPPPTVAHSAVMAASPTSRRRAALTPSQTWRHATGSYYAPEPHVNEEWIYRSTDTIPEASSSTSGSNPASSPKPEFVSAPGAELPISPTSSRSRSFSSAGVHYSSAHRRVPSSPSFSSVVLSSNSYFDRPPSPPSSISSRSSDPTMKTSLSLSEMLVSTATLALSNATLEPCEHADPARREEQREERRLSMRERHAALRELRDRNKWSKTQARC